MMKLYDFIYELNCVIPETEAEDWDNCGFQINIGNKKIEKVLVALEITESIADEAVAGGYDLIITHHPVLFEGINNIDINTPSGSYLIKLINAGISVYSCHTNFDKCPGGNNDYLANLLEMNDLSLIEDEEFTRMGSVVPCTVAEIAKNLAEKLDMDISEFRIIGDVYETVDKVGLCTGAGAEFIDVAYENGCELFITGDVKHHQARYASEIGINVIDAGHYGTERIFADAFIELMGDNNFTDDITFDKSESCSSPFFIIK